MTDRVHSVTVVLADDVREDDVEATLTALRMVRGVLAVEPHVTDVRDVMARERARHDLGVRVMQAVTDVVYPRSR